MSSITGPVLSSVSMSAEKPLRVLMVTGIYPTRQNPHSGTFIKTLVDSLEWAGVEVEVVYPKLGFTALRYVSAAMQVCFKTLFGHIDVVHGHYGQWCLLARMQWTKPVVASFLGSDLLGDVSFEGKGTLKGFIEKRISRWVCKHVDVVNVKTEAMKQSTPAGTAEVYSDGVDFDLFHPIPRVQARAALGWKQDYRYILFGNNPNRPVKNFPLAQAAVEQLRAMGVEAEMVVATGQPQTRLVQYINASDAVLLTSYSEGSPNIVKEAMACNVPVVSTDVGDVAQLIGRTSGCSVCSHDARELAAALDLALQHVQPTTGRADIAHLDSLVIAQQVIAMYRRAADRKKKRTPYPGARGGNDEPAS